MEFFQRKLRQQEESSCARVWSELVMWKFSRAEKKDGEKTIVGVTAANVCHGKRGPLFPNPLQVERQLRAHVDFPADHDVAMNYDDDGIYASIVFTKKK